MNFFKRLFSSKKETNSQDSENLKVHSNKASTNRYSKYFLSPELIDGCLKMISGYLIDSKIERKIENPINHPINLDQVCEDGLDYAKYCRLFKMEDKEAVFHLAAATSDYLQKKYGFVLLKDSKPEYPLRKMNLTYNKNNVQLSVYPFEYATKVLNGEKTFSDLDAKIDRQLKELHSQRERLKNFLE